MEPMFYNKCWKAEKTTKKTENARSRGDNKILKYEESRDDDLSSEKNS